MAGQGQQVAGARLAAVGQGQGVLAREPRSPAADVGAVPPGEAGVLDQPGGAGLHPPVGLLPGRGSLRERVGVDDGVGEEGAGAPGVVVVGVEDHALAGTQAQDRVADRAQRRPLAGLDTEHPRQLAVAHGRGQGAGGELEGHREHHVAPGLGLEPRVAVGEVAVGVGQGADLLVAPVVGAHRGDRLGDLLAVGTDVLHRRGPHAAGDAGERLDTDPAALDGGRHERVPVLPRRDRHQHAAAGRVVAAGVDVGHDPSGGHLDHRAGEPLVGHHQVAPAAQEQHRLPRRVGGGDGCDQLGLGARAHPARGGAAQAQGGALGEPRVGGAVAGGLSHRRPPRHAASRAPSCPRR